uniref:ER lumen protein-retaining receptor n=1 Tax=Oryctolagus cuniculus TaxID=9986 RepID=G1SUJ1_RABIT
MGLGRTLTAEIRSLDFYSVCNREKLPGDFFFPSSTYLKGKETEIFHLLFHSANVCDRQGRATAKPGAQNSLWVSLAEWQGPEDLRRHPLPAGVCGSRQEAGVGSGCGTLGVLVSRRGDAAPDTAPPPPPEAFESGSGGEWGDSVPTAGTGRRRLGRPGCPGSNRAPFAGAPALLLPGWCERLPCPAPCFLGCSRWCARAGVVLLPSHSCPVLCPGLRPAQILWTFSIYLESVAILPQLFMVSKTGEAETITSHYLFALGVYRTLYLFNWIWRYHFEGFFDLIAIVAGLVQTVLYCDFFYLYVTKVLKGKKLSLPA